MGRLDVDAWVDGAAALLAEEGLDGLRVEVLARRLGVTKGSFYWHFADRAALLAAVLARFEDRRTLAVIRDVDAASVDPVARLHALTEVTFGTEAADDRAEAALRAWAATDERASAVVARVDRRRLRYVRELLEAAGVPPVHARRRATLLYRTMIGEWAWRSAGGAPLEATARRELVELFTRP